MTTLASLDVLKVTMFCALSVLGSMSWLTVSVSQDMPCSAPPAPLSKCRVERFLSKLPFGVMTASGTPRPPRVAEVAVRAFTGVP